MSPDVIRVLLVDDHMVVRAGLKSLLGATADIKVIAEVGNGHDAVTYAERLKPDVVIMDLSMPGMDGTAATREIVKTVPGTRVLVLTVHSEDEALVAAMEAGASGYLVKHEADRELVNAVRAVARGGAYLRPSGERVLATRRTMDNPEQTERDRYDRLTEREREVLRLVAQGYSAAEIGMRLSISPKSVETYKQRIQEKLNIAHRSEYVQFAYRAGVLAAN